MPTPQLTQGDLMKALSPVAGGLHSENPLGEGSVVVHLPQLLGWRTEVRV